jgi:hypothetical protein
MRRNTPVRVGRLATLARSILITGVLCFPFVAEAQRATPVAASAERPRALLAGDRATLARACLVAAAEAEARLGLPSGLLAAVALTESAAHPFAIGTATRAAYPATRAEAERLARTAPPGAAGGCFQINISVHAADDPSWVFDPWASALFAGRKLAGHHDATEGDWPAALARYLGAAPGTEAARLYQCRVAASLAGLGRPQPPGLGTLSCRGGEARTAQAKATTLLAKAQGPTALAALP